MMDSREYHLAEPANGWRAREAFSAEEKLKLRPIESAPKDGGNRRTLAWSPNATSAYVAFWREHGLAPNDDEHGRLTLSGMRVRSVYGVDPTHWRPLPEPPAILDRSAS